ncbi:hypothetical protein CANMA_001465 [Candida margitis]|uniref:uncharacterized protein n=1 Tax=Candida margitis TaxID=1775924 RepID=UPI0022271FD6|nr:uncharacterized protein CANMA_001465 [Candida margitis]KAI5969398.1 hypothetical protein CANMA_001465 [Candida margitis]
MPLPQDAILDALKQVQEEAPDSTEELLLMIRDKLLETRDQSNIVLLAQFSKSLYTTKKSQLLIPALDLYQAEKPLDAKSQRQLQLETLISYYKYTFFNLVNILIEQPTEAIKSQTKLFGLVYNNLNTDETLVDEELLYASLAKNVEDLCSDKRVPSRVSNEVRAIVKNQNAFLTIKHLSENAGVNRFPVSSIRSMLQVEDVTAIFAGQQSLNYEIVNDVLILTKRPRELTIDQMVKTQLETTRLTQRLRDTM